MCAAAKPAAPPSERLIVTAALPYANGSLHLGHMVEYCQADMYVRALRRLGRQVTYICANDAHGTPIEVNAGRLGVTPEALVQRVHEEHQADFSRFDVSFDHFGITHSKANRELVLEVYAKLRQGGHLEDREMELSWCDQDQRFLPDRFVRGTCPYCKAKDQYGDVCEVCQRTYSPTELVEPRCILCGTKPRRRQSTHVFFKLSAPEHVAFLTQWIDSGALQPDQANYVRTWIEKGLKDWCITRDGPYFGFEVPDRPGKYFYVWLDAPFGYAAASREWGDRQGIAFDDLWRSPKTRIEHLIGKDIVYFHTLFWPAVLRATGFSLPAKVFVHGMLTVDGEKMSKSRGTFINAKTFAAHVEPAALRYYYASKYGAGAEDLDLAFDDFVLRVNSELVNKHANLFSRAAQFVHGKLDGRLGDLPFPPEAAQAPAGADDPALLGLARSVVAHCRAAEDHYRARELGHAVRELCAVADIGNELMQERAPWNQLKVGDVDGARETCTFALNVCYALAAYLWPVVPRFAEAGARILGTRIERMSAADLFRERSRPIGPMERLFERIDRAQVDAVIAASTQGVAPTAAPAVAAEAEAVAAAPASSPAPKPAPTPAAAAAPGAAPAPAAPGGTITFDAFGTIDLRVGVVRTAERVPKSKKLLRLQVDLGEPQARQIVAGLAHVYAPEALVGTQVVVVANLAPAKLMGVESHGMVLAAGEGDDLAVVRLDRVLAPGTKVR